MKLYVNVSCANLYRNSTFHSEIDTQAVLWEELQFVEEANGFCHVITEDGYRGWINNHQIAETTLLRTQKTRIITQPCVVFYEKARELSPAVRDGVAGSYTVILNETRNWLQTTFPDGKSGWLRKQAIAPLPKLTRRSMVKTAKSYLGLPYQWGGKTPKGLDCSGFVQLIHKLFGIKLRRDAWMQFEDAHAVSTNPLTGKSGDLMFFSESKPKVTHVGFCLGDGKVLHARGLVRIDSLVKADPLFNESLLQDFVEIRTYL